MSLLERVVRDDGRTPLAALASEQGLPVSTAHRFMAVFERRGWVARAERGRYIAGGDLAGMARDVELDAILTRSGRPVLRKLARRTGLTAHLGVLRAEMVTYLLKAPGGRTPLFTREAMQLEAYCSAVGKVLLSHLPPEAQAAYVDGGPFVALTANTVIDPARLREALAQTRARGYGVDDAEVADNLYCVAVPVRDADGQVVAAISASRFSNVAPPADPALVAELHAAAAALCARVFRTRP